MLVITLDHNNSVTFEPPAAAGGKRVLRFVDWMNGDTMLVTTPDPERQPFQLTLFLKMNEWVQPFPGVRLKLYDQRGRVAIEAPQEIRITRVRH